MKKITSIIIILMGIFSTQIDAQETSMDTDETYKELNRIRLLREKGLISSKDFLQQRRKILISLFNKIPEKTKTTQEPIVMKEDSVPLEETEKTSQSETEGLEHELFDQAMKQQQLSVQKDQDNHLLQEPVTGQKISAFGERKDMFSKGTLYQVNSKKEISAPLSGQIIFCGPFKQYGNIIIIDHNSEYHVLLAGIGQVSVTEGMTVSKGQIIGHTMPKSKIYLELRYKGQPINPAEGLLKKR